MITTHQFIDKYPIEFARTKLILGTIHPHDHSDFKLPFFYGNRNSIWRILAKAFQEDFSEEPTLVEIIKFLAKNKIGISDTIIECGRKNLTAQDSDLINIKFNNKLFSQIQNSEITEILFTSGLSKNNACKLFIEELLTQKKITKTEKAKLVKNLKDIKEGILEKSIFGRKIKLSILFSPSGSANIGISKSKLYTHNFHLFKESKNPVSEFKVWFYKKKFSA